MLEKKPWLLRPEEVGMSLIDARIVCMEARKVYPGEHYLALNACGARIRVWRHG